jgi:hypothetical protein
VKLKGVGNVLRVLIKIPVMNGVRRSGDAAFARRLLLPAPSVYGHSVGTGRWCVPRYMLHVNNDALYSILSRLVKRGRVCRQSLTIVCAGGSVRDVSALAVPPLR